MLYYGPLACVEDVRLLKGDLSSPSISGAMVAFGNKLQESSTAEKRDALRVPSLNLAHAIRSQIGPSFDLELGIVTERKP